MYKGYIEVKNKKAIEKFKNRTDFKTLAEVKSLSGYAGVLDQNTILLDIDDTIESDILYRIVKDLDIKCRVVKTTRGKHFYFKNTNVDKCHTGINVAIGLKADIKVGSKSCYGVLKIDGKEREIERDCDNNPDPMPKFLTPIKVKVPFLEMTEGAGRNQALFNYILTLQANGFTVDDARETLKIINKYILKQPLSDKEFEVIVRDESFKKPIFYNGDTFLFEKFASYLINQFNIKKINGQLHIYKAGKYIQGYSHIEHEMIKIIPHLSRAKRVEVLNYIEIILNESVPLAPAEFIGFKNGILNISTGELIPFSPQMIITNQIPWNYEIDNIKSEIIETVLNNISCNDREIRTLIEEMIGYTMYARNELGKCFILVGDGENGKSTLLKMVSNLLGEDNISALDLKNLGDRFSTIMLFNKLANIGDDISSEFLADTAIFKKIVTGEMIDAEQKGLPKFNFRPFVKLIFSANSIPRIGRGKDTGAVKRRLIIIPLKARFNKKQKDYKPFIADELASKEAIEYLIKIAIDGLKRVLKNNAFSECKESESELESFEEENNPMLGFFNECDKYENETTDDIYRQYTVYCSENNQQPATKITFIKQLLKVFPDHTIKQMRVDGKNKKVIVRGEEC